MLRKQEIRAIWMISVVTSVILIALSFVTPQTEVTASANSQIFFHDDEFNTESGTGSLAAADHSENGYPDLVTAKHGDDTGDLRLNTNSANLAFIDSPAWALRGVAFTNQPAVTIQDANGNMIPENTMVTIAITPGTGTANAVLSGTTTVKAAGGVATFSGLSINLTGTGYTLTATSGSFAQAISDPFEVNKPISSPTVISTIKIEECPLAIVVNPTSNRIYVANLHSSDVSVIDGYTNSEVTKIKIGSGPRGIAVNTIANRIYVTNEDSNNISVIDGSTDKVIDTVSVGEQPFGIAVNSTTNRIYVTNDQSSDVSVIDGFTDQVIDSVSVGEEPLNIAVNPVTNRIYVSSTGNDCILVINGSTNKIIETIKAGSTPESIAVNQSTNRIYVANLNSNNVSIIDGSTNSVINTVNMGTDSNPHGVAVNPITNRIYVASTTNQNVSVIDGDTENIIDTVNTESFSADVAINPITNRIYTANSDSQSVSVIDIFTEKKVITVKAGSGPSDLAINQDTNRIYVTNSGSKDISVIDGSTKSGVSTINPGSNLFPYAIAVNPNTNLIYVANSNNDNISVINGANDRVIDTVKAGIKPVDIALNPVTNRIYVANSGSNNITVIDGLTNSLVSTVNVGRLPVGIAVNTVTNLIYIVNQESDNVSIINGLTDKLVASVNLVSNSSPCGIAINPTTNRIYVYNYQNKNISVINGFTNKVMDTINTGSLPSGIGVNPATNRIYVSDSKNRSILVINGFTNRVRASIKVGSDPLGIGIDPSNNRIYVANGLSDTVSIIQESVLNPPTIMTDILPEGLAENIYSETLTAIDGIPPYRWYKIGEWPPGFDLSIDGVISGKLNFKITDLTEYNFIVKVIDSAKNNQAVTKSYTIIMYPGLDIFLSGSTKALTKLPDADANSLYTCKLSTSGGKPPYVWSKGSDFPKWLNIDRNKGILSGTPTTDKSIRNVNIVITDSLGYTFTKSATLKVNKALTITTESLPSDDFGVNYKTTTLKASGGAKIYSWTLVSGKLPAGLSWNAKNSTISGTPILGSSGIYPLTFQVNDGIATVLKILSITINPEMLIGNLPDGKTGAAYSQNLSVFTTGGSGTGYVYAIPGTLPPGLRFSAKTGTIYGIPKTAGTYTFEIKVTDSLNGTKTQNVTIRINIPK